jgi:hypothetical protein
MLIPHSAGIFLHAMEPSLSHHHLHVAIVSGAVGKLGDSPMICTSPVVLETTRMDGSAATPCRPTAARPTKDKKRAILTGSSNKSR